MKRQRGVHDGYDRKKQSVKMTDIFGVEKVWGAAYENNRQHGDVSSKKKVHVFLMHTTEYSTPFDEK